jgi:integrase
MHFNLLDQKSSASANSAMFDIEKAKSLVRSWPSITVDLYDSGHVGFVARPVIHGQRQNRSFSTSKWKTLEEAAKLAIEFCKNVKVVEKTEKVSAFPIPLSIRPKLEYHINEIQEAGFDPIEALKLGFEALKARSEISRITFGEAAIRVIEFKRTQNKGEQYVRDLATQYRAFGKEFGEHKLAEITATDIEDFLSDRGLGPVSWNNWRRLLNILWNFAMLPRNKWVKENAAAQVAIKAENAEEVTALTIEQAKQILKIASSKFERLMPYLVLGMFCGLRRGEIQWDDETQKGVKWEDIDWESESIRVHSGKDRMVSTRYVHLEPVAGAWLKRYASEGPITTGKNARRADLAELRELTFDFDGNIFRHTYGSYHSQAFKDFGRTQAEMGHYSLQMLIKRYRKPLPKIYALGFWQLFPEAVLNS